MTLAPAAEALVNFPAFCGSAILRLPQTPHPKTPALTGGPRSSWRVSAAARLQAQHPAILPDHPCQRPRTSKIRTQVDHEPKGNGHLKRSDIDCSWRPSAVPNNVPNFAMPNFTPCDLIR